MGLTNKIPSCDDNWAYRVPMNSLASHFFVMVLQRGFDNNHNHTLMHVADFRVCLEEKNILSL